MNDLFQYLDLLVETINKASTMRQQLLPFLGSQQKIEEIKQMLTGSSIQLPAVQTPLAQRELLTVIQTVNKVTPDQLLQVMTNTFSVARDAVLAVDAAWSKLDETLVNAQAQIQQLEKLAVSLNQDQNAELLQLKAVVTSQYQHIEQDPLGVSENWEQQIEPMLIQVRSTLAQVAKQKIQVREKMAIAQDMLEQLKIIYTKSLAIFAETQEKIVDNSIRPTPLTQVQIDALSQWLIRLETKYQEGIVNPVIIGLDNWLLKAKECITTIEEADINNNHLLQTRRELRGRLSALEAKAQAKGLIENVTLVTLAKQTQKLLYTRPTPLAQAIELVSQYEKQLNKQH